MARGDGSVERLKSGRFRARVDLGFRTDGTRNRPSKTFSTRTEANEWKREQLRLHDAGTRPDAGAETVGQWLARWLTVRQADMEPRGYEVHERHSRLYLTPLLGHLLLRDLRPAHVRSLDERLVADGRSPALRRTILTTLRAALGDAVRIRLLASNPAAGLRMPSAVRKEFTCWNAAQALAFLAEAAVSPHYVFFAVALDSGMRLGELLALHWPAVDLETGVLAVLHSLDRRQGRTRLKATKTRAGRRKVTLAPQTLTLLRDHHASQEQAGRLAGPVFCSQTGGYLHTDHMRERHFYPAIARAGVPRIRFHDLRHTCATLLLAAGVNVKAVSARLGHASITVTLSIYAHHLPEMESQAAAVLGQALYGDTGSV